MCLLAYCLLFCPWQTLLIDYPRADFSVLRELSTYFLKLVIDNWVSFSIILQSSVKVKLCLSLNLLRHVEEAHCSDDRGVLQTLASIKNFLFSCEEVDSTCSDLGICHH